MVFFFFSKNKRRVNTHFKFLIDVYKRKNVRERERKRRRIIVGKKRLKKKNIKPVSLFNWSVQIDNIGQ